MEEVKEQKGEEEDKDEEEEERQVGELNDVPRLRKGIIAEVLPRFCRAAQSLYSPCTVPVQSRLQSRLRKLVGIPPSRRSRSNIKMDGYFDSH